MVSTSGEIQLRHVQKVFTREGYEDVKVLEDVTVIVPAGSFVSIIGASGCGKTTLLRLMAGLDQPSSGGIYVDGNQVTKPHHERGFVFQQARLFPWLNLYDNIAFGLRARGLYQQEKGVVGEWIELVGLTGFEKAHPHQLSGGMQQRVALARALVNNPKVLLMDEPLGALDSLTRELMQDELLRIWQAKGTTMVMVTHDVEEAIYLSEKILVMTPTNAHIEKMVEVPLPYPRNRESGEFRELKTQILQFLNIKSRFC